MNCKHDCGGFLHYGVWKRKVCHESEGGTVLHCNVICHRRF